MKIIPQYLILSLLTLVSLPLPAQGWQADIEQYFNKVRSKTYPALPANAFSEQNERGVLSFINPYLTDSSTAVATKAHEIYYAISSKSDDVSIRTLGVQTLLRACSQADREITGTVLDLVIQFNKDDFTLAAKDSVRKLVKNENHHLEELMKIAAFLDLKDLIPDIRPYSQPGNQPSKRWAAIISLARMGESSAVGEMMKRVSKLPMNDNLVYNIFPDLVFTHRPEAIAFLVEELGSNERNCLSADIEREVRIPCGYRIMEQLAPVIGGFPFDLDESGDLKTSNYPAALATVRQWFSDHNTYVILNRRY